MNRLNPTEIAASAEGALGLPAIESPPLLSISQAAQHLGVSTDWVWKRTQTREIPVVCLGRRRLIRPEDLQQFVDERVERAR